MANPVVVGVRPRLTTLPITIMNGGFPSTMTDAYLKKFAWRASNLD